MRPDSPLTLDVTDCGPIARARVELRPLTVFVGPSNTGKSWLATLAYALHRYFAADLAGWLLRYRIGPWSPEDAGLVRAAAAELAAATSRSAEPEEKGIELTASIEAAVRLHVEEEGTGIGKEVERCFGLDAGRLARAGSPGGGRILLRHAIDGVATPVEHELNVRGDGWTFRPAVPDGLRIRSLRHALADLLLAKPESEAERARREWEAVGVLSRGVLPVRVGLRMLKSSTVEWLRGELRRGELSRAALGRGLCAADDWRNADGSRV